MASDRQINANRENAKHCTGPRTAEGKEKSSRNALKTGIDAKSEIILLEKREELEALTADYYARYHPTVPEDRALVDMLISNEWFLRRYRSVDAALFDRAFADIDSQSLGRAYRSVGELSDRVSRRINAAQRNLQRALKQLTEIRAKRVNEPDQTWIEPVAEDIAPEPLNSESVSFREQPQESPAEPEPPATPETEPQKLVNNDRETPTIDQHPEENPPIAA